MLRSMQLRQVHFCPALEHTIKLIQVNITIMFFAVLHTCITCMKCFDCGAVVVLVSEAKFKFSQRRKSIIQKCPTKNKTFTFKSRFIESKKGNTVLTCTSQGRARAPSPRVKTKVQKHNKTFNWAGFYCSLSRKDKVLDSVDPSRVDHVGTFL